MAYYEYCVCQIQEDRVTFVNHEWVGSGPMNVNDSAESLALCSRTHEYLNAAGSQGWELVNVVSLPAGGSQADGRWLMYMYLRRQID